MSVESPPSRWYTDPPANDGSKVVISDTDHYAPGQGDALWVWKSFLRGHHPILMDFGLINGMNPFDLSVSEPSYASFEPTRAAMGDSRRYAERVNLLGMIPRGDLTSTGYALVNPGQEYLILQPDPTTTPFSVKLATGAYTVNWFSLNLRQTLEAETVVVERDQSNYFITPFQAGGPVVLHLKVI